MTPRSSCRRCSRAPPAARAGLIPVSVGIVTLLLGATAVFGQLQDALNTVWAVAPKPGAVLTTLLRKRLHSFALVVGIGFLLLVSLVLSAGLSGFSRYLERTLNLPVDLLQLANFVVSFLVITLLFAMIYRLLPDVRLAWRDVWLGSVLTRSAVRRRQDADRLLPRPHRRRFGLRRRRLAGGRSCSGSTTLADLLLRRRAHPRPLTAVPRRPASSRRRGPMRDAGGSRGSWYLRR